MSRPYRFNHLAYPLCLALTWGGSVLGQEAPQPQPITSPLVILDADTPLGTGVLPEAEDEELLVPPLPESIELAPEQVVESDPPASEPAAIVADAEMLPAPSGYRQLDAPVSQPKVSRPIRTLVSDPLAELKAQQEALRLEQQALEAELHGSEPQSVLITDSSGLQPIESSELPTVNPDTIEVVKQRYADGSIKLAYEVGRDAEDNYVKHGSWKLFNLKGDVIAQGEYRNNQRHGTWRRWHNGFEAEMFLKAPYTQFQPPFFSQAEFKHDQLDGVWTVADSQQRKASEIHFRDGLRHGKATWWHASGSLMQEIDFVEGEIHGELNVWNADGTQLAHHIYEHGRHNAPKVTKYPNGQIKSEGSVLEARTFITEPDDWWNAKTAVFTKEGMDEKHGVWKQWHPNGTLHVEGTYSHHVEDGKFTWWYATGQKALVGNYRNGQRDGHWCWWHPNGQKQSEGMFAADEAIATWIWWNEEGVVERKVEGGEGNPASRTAEGNGSKVKPTSFGNPMPVMTAPQLQPVPLMIR